MSRVKMPMLRPTGAAVEDANTRELHQAMRALQDRQDKKAYFNDLRHGEKKLIIQGVSGSAQSGTWTTTPYTYITPDAAARVWSTPIPLLEGDRIRKVRALCWRGGGTLTFTLQRADLSVPSVYAVAATTVTATTGSFKWAPLSNIDLVIPAEQFVYIDFTSGHANDRLWYYEVTYDRPE